MRRAAAAAADAANDPWPKEWRKAEAHPVTGTAQPAQSPLNLPYFRLQAAAAELQDEACSCSFESFAENPCFFSLSCNMEN